MSKEDGGPAFPANDAFTSGGDSHVNDREYKGMSLRDYFAGQALVGLLSHDGSNGNMEDAASDAYRCADFLLEARKK